MRIRAQPVAGGLPGLLLATLAALVIGPRPAAALVVHISPDGVDGDGCGEVASPCASLRYAHALGSVAGPGDVIQLAAGTYPITRQTAVVVYKGGLPGSPFTIRGAGPSSVLDGTDLNSGAPLMIDADEVVLEDLAVAHAPWHNIVARDQGVTMRRVVSYDVLGGVGSCILLDSADGSLLEDVQASGCLAAGIQVEQSADVRIVGAGISAANGHGIHALSSGGLSLEGVRLSGNGAATAGNGVTIEQCSGFTIGAAPTGAPSEILGSTGAGVYIVGTADGSIGHAVLAGNSAGIEVAAGTPALALAVDHVTIVDHTRAAIVDGAAGTALTLTNSIVAFNPAGGITLASAQHRYNVRYQNGNSEVALDATELEADPLFADRTGRDLHLRSVAGRYAPGQGWVLDAVTSPAIDRADPAAPYDLETDPHGGRANAGAFGDTPQASRSGAGPLPDAGLPDLVAPADTSAASDTAAAADTSPGADRSSEADAGAAIDADALPDIAAHEAAQPDDSGAVVVVVARAGQDRTVQASSEVVLDGTESSAPANASFLWTLADGPEGPRAEPIAERAFTQIKLDDVGIYAFQLTVSTQGISDSDMVEIEVTDSPPGAVAGCGCDTAGRAGPPAALALVALGMARWRRRRARI